MPLTTSSCLMAYSLRMHLLTTLFGYDYYYYYYYSWTAVCQPLVSLSYDPYYVFIILIFNVSCSMVTGVGHNSHSADCPDARPDGNWRTMTFEICDVTPQTLNRFQLPINRLGKCTLTSLIEIIRVIVAT